MTPRLSLRVTLAAGRSRGLVRMARTDLEALGLRSGDTARLEAGRRTHVRVVAGRTPTGTLVLDSTVAENAGVGDGAEVRVLPAPLPQLRGLLLLVDHDHPASPADLTEALYDMSLTEGDRIALVMPGGRTAMATVVSTQPEGGGLSGDATVVTVEAAPSSAPTFEGVGGLADQIARVEEMICQRRLQSRPFGGANPGHWARAKRHDARAHQIACACHGALARRANPATA